MCGCLECASRSSCDRHTSTIENAPASLVERWRVYLTHPSSRWVLSITPRRISSAYSTSAALTFMVAITVT